VSQCEGEKRSWCRYGSVWIGWCNFDSLTIIYFILDLFADGSKITTMWDWTSSAPTNILSVSGLVSGSARRIRYVHYSCSLMIDLRLLFLFHISNHFILLQIRSLWKPIAYWLARAATNSLMKSSRSFRGVLCRLLESLMLLE
jgi:hypothetical protein